MQELGIRTDLERTLRGAEAAETERLQLLSRRTGKLTDSLRASAKALNEAEAARATQLPALRDRLTLGKAPR